MSPEKASVVVIEDDLEFAATLKIFLERSGHRVLGVASSLSEGRELIEEVSGKDVDAVLIDGNLSTSSSDGVDGQTLADIVRKKLPEAKVVCIALERKDWSDTPTSKRDGGASISKAITEI